MNDPALAGPDRSRTRLALRVSAAALTVLGLGILVAAVASSASEGGSYGAASDFARFVGLAAGVVLIAVGVAVSIYRPQGSTGLMVIAVGVAWLSFEAVAWAEGPALIRSTAMVLELFLFPVLAHLGLVFPYRWLARRSDRALVGAAYGAALVLGLGRIALYDPFLDPNCWRNCADNVFLIMAEPGIAKYLHIVWLWSVVVLGIAVVWRILYRLESSPREGRRWTWPVLVPLAAAVTGEIVRAVALLVQPAEGPQLAFYSVLFVVRGALLAAVGCGVAWVTLETWRLRRSLATLADDLEVSPSAGTLESILAEGLGDTTLRVTYWSPTLGRYVDSRGQSDEPGSTSGHATTAVERSGELLALVLHDPSLAVSDLEREIGSTARLAIDNERLRAELLAQLAEIRSSQARIVVAADTTRRQLERDLHDGAQQRMLALSYEVRLAREAAVAGGDGAALGNLSTASDQVQLALADLRELAHGIFPSVLADGGLAPALSALVERSRIPVEVISVPGDRFSDSVEMAAYLTVLEVVEVAAQNGGDLVRVTAGAERDELEITLHVDGLSPTRDDLVRSYDRVGAAAGRVDFDEAIRVVVPCE